MNGRRFVYMAFGMLIVPGGLSIMTGRVKGPATATFCYGSVLVGAVGNLVMRSTDQRD